MSTKITKNQQKILDEKVFLDKEEVSIIDLMNKTKDLMIEQSVNREAETAYFFSFLIVFLFFFTFLIVFLLGFLFVFLTLFPPSKIGSKR